MCMDCFYIALVNLGTKGMFEGGVGTVAVSLRVDFYGHVYFMLSIYFRWIYFYLSAILRQVRMMSLLDLYAAEYFSWNIT